MARESSTGCPGERCEGSPNRRAIAVCRTNCRRIQRRIPVRICCGTCTGYDSEDSGTIARESRTKT
eukprot:3734752-Rhodomonas_salina.3